MSWDSGPRVTEDEMREALRIWGNEFISTYEVPKFKKGSSKYQEAINHLRACEENMMRNDTTLKYGFYFKAEADLLELARRVDLESLEDDDGFDETWRHASPIAMEMYLEQREPPTLVDGKWKKGKLR